MTYGTQEYDVAKIRELLIAAFTVKDLRRFCYDRPAFRPVVNELAPDHGLADLVDLVIEHCRTHFLWHELLTEVSLVRGRQYARFQPALGRSAPLPTPGTTPALAAGRGWRWWIWGGGLLLALILIGVGIRLLIPDSPAPPPTSPIVAATDTTAPLPTPTEAATTPAEALLPSEPSVTPTPTRETVSPSPPSAAAEAPTPTKTPEAPAPTNTPETPTPTAVPVTPTPSCALAVTGLFSGLYERYQGQLGCPKEAEPLAISDAEQQFEYGRMFWRSDSKATYAVYELGAKAGTYKSFRAWDEQAYDCPYSPPQGRFLPTRGFGWVWCTQLEAPVVSMGWGLAGEVGYGPGTGDPLVQDFDRGVIFRDNAGRTERMAYLFLSDGSVRREPY